MRGTKAPLLITMPRPQIIFDTECYSNFWLFGYRPATGGPSWKCGLWPGKPAFTPAELQHLAELASDCTWVGFNSLNYDLPMIRLALCGASTEQLKQLNDAIIMGGLKRWEVERAGYAQHPIKIDHVDIMEVIPGVRIGLKTYMARNHSRTLQDLPHDPAKPLSVQAMREIWDYHDNDLRGTGELLGVVAKRLEFRDTLGARYGVDLRSKSDAQMSEAIIAAKLGYRPEVPYIPSGTRFKALRAPWLQFASGYMRNIAELCYSTEFEWNRKDDSEVLPDGTKAGVSMPPALAKLRVTIGNTTYKFGIGGLHSMETGRTLRGPLLQDSDVASFYPELVRLLRVLSPEQQAIYEAVLVERVDAKHRAAAGDTEAKTIADSAKILLNGLYGKLWSKYSFACNPQAGVSITIAGQLSLLMLIERLELGGVTVHSANTDGIVTQCPARLDGYRQSCMAWWEKQCGFTLEHTQYSLLAQRDVNNYIAVDATTGKVKRKGVFAKSGVLEGMQGGHPDRDISKDAAVAYMVDGVPIEATVRACTDIRKFVMSRKVKGGAYHAGKYLGPTARWYYSRISTEPLRYANGNKVASSDNAMPCMVMPDGVPWDMDHARYEQYALELVDACCYK